MLAAIAYAVLVAVVWYVKSLVSIRDPVYRPRVIGFLVLFWAASNIFAGVYLHGIHRYAFSLISTIVTGSIFFQEIYQFWKIGLIGADEQTSKGIDYVKALNLCTTSIDFLGLGAGKLTANRNVFENAVDKCDAPGRAIRFLLINPSHDGLRRIARNAGADESAYQNRVRQSLRIIAYLRNDRAKNIEVRFYDSLPAFRLMFINDEVCLVSHYVLGKGDGSQLPQLHIIKRRPAQDINSLYHGFKEYFEKIWADSSVWNFEEFLDE
jgi:hypothetical protein